MTAPGRIEATACTVVCRVDDIQVESGVCALVRGEAIAIFRTYDGNVYAISNYDPCSGASVLARGIVGTRGEIPVVSSPMHKQAFDLRNGQCLDDAAVHVPSYDVQVTDGHVRVGLPRESP